MSDPTQYNEPVEPGTESENMRALREAADRGRADKARADGAERELAFAKAGIDTDTKLGRLLLGSYDGELTREALQAEWAELNPAATNPAPQVQPAPIPGQESETTIRRQLASEGGILTEITEPVEDWVEAGYKGFTDAMRAGKSREDASAHVIGRNIAAALEGDERAAWPGHWTNEQLGKPSR